MISESISTKSSHTHSICTPKHTNTYVSWSKSCCCCPCFQRKNDIPNNWVYETHLPSLCTKKSYQGSMRLALHKRVWCSVIHQAFDWRWSRLGCFFTIKLGWNLFQLAIPLWCQVRGLKTLKLRFRGKKSHVYLWITPWKINILNPKMKVIFRFHMFHVDFQECNNTHCKSLFPPGS